MTVAMLTTVDNPYDPFTQFDQWYAFDNVMGYHSCEYLARLAPTADDLSPADNNLLVSQAIDEIVALNVLGIYKKVVREFDDE